MGRPLGIKRVVTDKKSEKPSRAKPVKLHCRDCKFEVGTKCTHPNEKEAGFYDLLIEKCFSAKN